jgi:hypothetical protein
MQPPAWNQNEVFPIVLELIAQEHLRHLRLISSQEVVARLLLDSAAKAIIDAARQQQPDAPAEQLASNLVASFAQSAAAPSSEWQSRVEALQISGEWFFRDKIVRIPSHESLQTGTPRAT